MSAQEAQAILGQLFAGGTALAGLVLVFLGGVLTAYDSYDREAKASVRGKYRIRAWAAFLGFLFSLISAAAGLAGLFFAPTVWLVMGLVSLALAGGLLVTMALLSVLEVR